LSCGLEEYELDILDTLFSRRCFTHKSSFNLLRIYKGYQRQFGREIVDVAKKLSDEGYITQKRRMIQNIISLIMIRLEKPFVCMEHGVIAGRIRHL